MKSYIIFSNGENIHIKADHYQHFNETLMLYRGSEETLEVVASFKNWDFIYLEEANE